jgi:hexokinase
MRVIWNPLTKSRNCKEKFSQRKVGKLVNITIYNSIIDFILDGLPAEMCVNTEWGGFGDDGKLNEFLTKWDDKVDDCSINAGEQRFEKSISGMYMVCFEGQIKKIKLI